MGLGRGFEFLFHLILGTVKQRHQINLFFCAEIEEGVQVTFGNDQRVTGGYRKSITNNNPMLTGMDDPLWW